MKGLSGLSRSHYTDANSVRDELRNAKRLFARKGYPIIDVSRRSIEETAAQIINLYKMHRPELAQEKANLKLQSGEEL